MIMRYIYDAIAAEIRRSEDEFPQSPYSDKTFDRCITLMVEEVGETAKALLHVGRTIQNEPGATLVAEAYTEAYNEAIQVAACAVQLANKIAAECTAFMNEREHVDQR